MNGIEGKFKDGTTQVYKGAELSSLSHLEPAERRNGFDIVDS